MKVKVDKQDKDMLLVELEGEGTGFSNLIREELWNDKKVIEAAQMKEHPYMSQPKVYVKTKGEKPKKALEDAAKRLQTKVKEFRKQFDRAFKD